MTVGELRRILAKVPADAEVLVGCDDYSRLPVSKATARRERTRPGGPEKITGLVLNCPQAIADRFAEDGDF